MCLQDYVKSSVRTSVGSKMSTAEDVVLAVAVRVILAGRQERCPRRYWVKPFLKVREKYCAGVTYLSVLVTDDVTIQIIVYVNNTNSNFQCVVVPFITFGSIFELLFS